MQNTQADKSRINFSNAIANQSAGKGAMASPAVPVLQNKSVPISKQLTSEQNFKQPVSEQNKLAANATNSSPVQFKLERWKPTNFETTPGTKKDKEEFAHAAAAKVSAAVDQAHAEIEVNNLADANMAYQALYLLRLKEHQNGDKTMHPSTSAGYIIESKVNNRLAGEAGFNFQNTGMLNGTRPDITVDLGHGQTALIDITAQKSLGHIFMKKGNWTNHGHIPYVAEAWYPSLSFTGKAEKLSPEQEQLAIEAARNKKALAELISKETAKFKNEQFLSAQDKVADHLTSASRKVHLYLVKRPRDMAALKAVGVDISEDAQYIIKTSIAARNKFLDIRVTTEENPAPRFTEESKIKAISIIDRAKRANPKEDKFTYKPEKKKLGGKWAKKLKRKEK